MKKSTHICAGIIFSCVTLFWVSGSHAIENSDCMDCHGDSSLTRKESQGVSDSLFVEQKAFQYSIHNINGIQCVDCHAEITTLDMEKDVPHSIALAPVNCAGCHEAEAAEYKKGVHQQASSKGITIQCYACHGYHDVISGENLPVLERENKSCLKCHNPSKFHNWLPQKEAHFSFVQCTVCHAPDTPHHIHLRFYDLAKKDFLRPETVLSALGTDVNGFMPMFDKDGKVDELNIDEFENMVFALNKRGVHATFHAELLSESSPAIHQVTRVAAKRACQDCHSPTAKLFDSVSIFFVSKDGAAHQFKVDRKVLESYSVNNFFVPGGSRIKKLDLVGIMAVVGAGAGVMLHLVGRAATASWRRKRRANSQKNDA